MKDIQLFIQMLKMSTASNDDNLYEELKSVKLNFEEFKVISSILTDAELSAVLFRNNFLNLCVNEEFVLNCLKMIDAGETNMSLLELLNIIPHKSGKFSVDTVMNILNHMSVQYSYLIGTMLDVFEDTFEDAKTISKELLDIMIRKPVKSTTKFFDAEIPFKKEYIEYLDIAHGISSIFDINQLPLEYKLYAINYCKKKVKNLKYQDDTPELLSSLSDAELLSIIISGSEVMYHISKSKVINLLLYSWLNFVHFQNIELGKFKFDTSSLLPKLLVNFNTKYPTPIERERLSKDFLNYIDRVKLDEILQLELFHAVAISSDPYTAANNILLKNPYDIDFSENVKIKLLQLILPDLYIHAQSHSINIKTVSKIINSLSDDGILSLINKRNSSIVKLISDGRMTHDIISKIFENIDGIDPTDFVIHDEIIFDKILKISDKISLSKYIALQKMNGLYESLPDNVKLYLELHL